MIARNVAIIGTAGRDKTKPMTKALWEAMCADASGRFLPDVGYHLISGGAAWADHVAVWLFLNGEVDKLTLHLPAPILEGLVFSGPPGSAATAANFYHAKFSKIIGKDSIQQITLARDMGAKITEQPMSEGYGAMFARNNLVAADANMCLAYTWGEGKVPADGGTKYTWDKITGRKVHVPLGGL